jgi:hypothetical protein
MTVPLQFKALEWRTHSTDQRGDSDKWQWWLEPGDAKRGCREWKHITRPMCWKANFQENWANSMGPASSFFPSRWGQVERADEDCRQSSSPQVSWTQGQPSERGFSISLQPHATREAAPRGLLILPIPAVLYPIGLGCHCHAIQVCYGSRWMKGHSLRLEENGFDRGWWGDM